MKINKFLVLGCTALAFAACSNNEELEEIGYEAIGQKHITLTAYTSASETRTALANEVDVVWQKGDEIGIINPLTRISSTSHYSVYDKGTQTEIANDASWANFGATLSITGQENENSVMYAVSPYTGVQKTTQSMYDGKTLFVCIPEAQVATPGSFDPAANVMVAKANINDTKANFYHTNALIKFTTIDATINSVTLEGLNGENIAKTKKIAIPGDIEATDTWVWTDPSAANTSKSVTLAPASGRLKAATTYYISIYPTNFTKGMILTFNTTKGVKTMTCPAPVDLGRAEIYDLEEVVYDVIVDGNTDPEDIKDAVQGGASLIITDDADLSEVGEIEVTTDVTITIENDKTLEAGTNQFVIKDEGQVTVNGGGEITTEKGAFVVEEGGALVIEDVTITTTEDESGSAIYNEGGEVTIAKDAEINASFYGIYSKDGDITIEEGATITSESSNLNGASAYAVTIDGGTATIGDCVIKGRQGALACIHGAIVTIEGGEFYANNTTPDSHDAFAAIYAASGAEVTINGGKFHSDREGWAGRIGFDDVVYDFGGGLYYLYYGIMNIKGGVFNSKPTIAFGPSVVADIAVLGATFNSDDPFWTNDEMIPFEGEGATGDKELPLNGKTWKSNSGIASYPWWAN